MQLMISDIWAFFPFHFISKRKSLFISPENGISKLALSHYRFEIKLLGNLRSFELISNFLRLWSSYKNIFFEFLIMLLITKSSIKIRSYNRHLDTQIKCHQPARISPIKNLKNDDKVNSRFTIDSWKLGNWRARRMLDLNFMLSVKFINYEPPDNILKPGSGHKSSVIGFFINYSSCQKWFFLL